MDACFEILLSSKQPIDNLECYQKMISWDGVEYPQDPKYYPSFTENEWMCLAVFMFI